MEKEWPAALAAVFVALGCAEMPRLTTESARVRMMSAWVEDLRHAYEARDEQAVLRLLPAPAKPPVVVGTLTRELAALDRVEVRFMIDRIVLDQQEASLSLHWDGAGRRVADAGLTRLRGEATVRFTADGPLTALGVAGDLPFVIAGEVSPR